MTHLLHERKSKTGLDKMLL